MNEELYDNIHSNKQLKNRINAFKAFLRLNGLSSILLSLLFIILLIFGLKNQIENLIQRIIICIVIILLIRIIIHGTNDLLRIIQVNKDLKNNKYKVINEQPRKIVFVTVSFSRTRKRRYFNHIELYYKNIKLYIPIDDILVLRKRYFKRTDIDIYKCKEECEKICCELKYLPKSRVVIDGAGKYYKIIDKYITSKLD